MAGLSTYSFLKNESFKKNNRRPITESHINSSDEHTLELPLPITMVLPIDDVHLCSTSSALSPYGDN